MNKNLLSYAKKYEGFLDKDLCQRTIDQIKKHEKEFIQHIFYDNSTEISKPLSGEQELDISYLDIPESKEIMDKLWHGIKRYIEELKMPWFEGWEGYSQPRFNKYSENKKMALHIDHIQSLFDGDRRGIPILSCLGLLNDDYRGGEFIMFGDTEIKFKAGDLLIFPSIFLYPHRVDAVKKGNRYSYISWVW